MHLQRHISAILATLALAAGSAGAVPALSLPPSARPGEAILAIVESSCALGELRGELRDQSGLLLDAAEGFELPASGLRPSAELPSAGPLRTRRYGILLAPGDAAKAGRLEVRASGVELPLGSEERAAAFALESPLALEARTWLSETIKLDAANSALRTDRDPRKLAEAEALLALLARVDGAAVHDPSVHAFPVDPEARRSAGFGDRRRYLYAKGGSEASVHAGIDLAVADGTPVHACAEGKVVLAALRMVTGYTIVIEHLPGLYSLYMHLSKPEVSAGDSVAAGQEIALSGSTGLSTGPHLHFELRLRGKAVDPGAWLRMGSH